ncbi:MAG: carboxymuconolactone decarboxylase family protein [Roseiarcus sp.]
MARVRSIGPEELAPDLRAIYEEFAGRYGPFRNQVAVIAHVTQALRHLMSMLLELRKAGRVKRRYIELAIVAVSKVNECHYCVAHHKPMLAVEGLSPSAADRVLDYQNHPDLDEVDKLVVEYSIAVTKDPQRIRDAMFERLRRHFDEAEIVELTLRATLCGFFNRFNDALQIDEEAEVRADSIGA